MGCGGAASVPPSPLRRASDSGTTISSTIEFHAPQPGHLPIHLLVSYPQDWQTYAVFFFFAISSPNTDREAPWELPYTTLYSLSDETTR